MTDTTETIDDAGFDRRRFITRAAGGAALVWAAPTVMGLDSRALAATGSDCTPVFNMNIDSEPVDQLAVSGAVGNLVVGPGNVDVIGQGSASFDWLPGNGKYLDLDGTSSSNPVDVSTNVSLDAGTTYRVVITLAGANTNGGPPGSADNNAAILTVGGTPFASYSYAESVPFTTTVFLVTPTTSGPLVIEHNSNPPSSSGDNVGMLLKDIVIRPVTC